MSQRNIDFGAFPDDPNADAIRSAFEKVQLNFTEVFAGLGDQAVVSVNKTTGAGITVNQPTGNVVVSANISNMTFRSSTMDLGVGSPGVGKTALITSSSQEMWIDLPSTFATAAGDFGYILANTSSGNGNINANNITLTNNVTGVGGAFTYVSGDGANLSAITGTNVTGAVSFATTANTVAGANVTGEVTFAATANAVAGANVSGEVDFAAIANAVAGANVSGEVPFAQVANSVAGANVSGEVDFAATANAVAGANVTGAVSTATVATTVSSAAQSNITSVGTLTSLSVTGNVSAGNVSGTGGVFTYVSGDGANLTAIDGQQVTGEVDFAQVSNSIAGANVTGEVSFASTANSVAGANVSGAVANATHAVSSDSSNAVAGSNVTGEVSFAATANAVAGANVSGEVTNAAIANSVAGANVSGEVGFSVVANSVAGANVSGTVANATYAVSAGTVETGAQPNITSTGTLTSLNVTGNIDAGNLTTTGLITGDGGGLSNISVSAGSSIVNGTSNATVDASGPFRVSVAGVANVLQVKNSGTNVEVTGSMSVSGGFDNNINFNSTANLGPESNVTITGGATNSFLKTDGAGGLSWDTATLVPAQGTDTQVIFNDGGTTYAGNTGFTFNKTTGVVAIAGNVTTGNVSGGLGSFTTVAGSLTTAAQPNISSVGTLTGLILSGNLNTNSDLITNAGNITISGGTGTFIGDGGGLTNIPGANVSGAVALATSATSANAVAGANVSGEVTNAATANAVAGANVSGAVSFATTANAVAGANVSGTVSSATIAGAVTTNAQPNITSVGTLTVLGVNGIITAQSFTANTGLFTGDGGGLSNIAGGNVSLVANATYATSAGSSTLAGTVTTAAQPNITSVGTLTTLGVSGTITASAVTANTGIFTGNGSGLSALTGANVSGAVTFATTANAVAGANVSGTVASATSATTAGSATTATTAGTVTTAAQPNITSVSTLLIHSSSDSISAAGSNQGTATALTSEINRVTSVPASTGVRLPNAEGGLIIFVTNTTATSLNVYPNTSDAINSLSDNIAFVHPGNATLQYICTNATNWYTVGATYA